MIKVFSEYYNKIVNIITKYKIDKRTKQKQKKKTIITIWILHAIEQILVNTEIAMKFYYLLIQIDKFHYANIIYGKIVNYNELWSYFIIFNNMAIIIVCN